MARSSAARVKNDAVEFPIPQTNEDVRNYIARIGSAQRNRKRLQDELDEQITKLKEQYQKKLDPIDEGIQELARGVQTYCEANRSRLTNDGRRKSHKFATGVVQWRMTPPRVSLRKIEDVIKGIRERKLGGRFIRMKAEVNKEGMLRSPELAKTIPGVSIKQREEFVIVPESSKLEEVQ